MYTEPKIFSSEDLKKRTYILFYLNGKRVRIYNGNLLDKDIHPNRAINLNDRSKSLNELLFELKTALRNNTFKLELDIPQHVERSYMTEEIFTIALNNKLDTDISLEYKRNLKYIHSDLMNFLTPAEKQAEVHQLKVSRIEAFLSKYNSSGTYYMNKRRDLSVMFSAVSKYSLTEQQFALLVGRCRMYQHLPRAFKEQIFPANLSLTDTQIGAVVKDYYWDQDFGSDSFGTLSLWQLFNLFTGANKSSYIDSFLDRSVNAHEFVKQLQFGLDNKQTNWFLN